MSKQRLVSLKCAKCKAVVVLPLQTLAAHLERGRVGPVCALGHGLLPIPKRVRKEVDGLRAFLRPLVALTVSNRAPKLGKRKTHEAD